MKGLSRWFRNLFRSIKPVVKEIVKARISYEVMNAKKDLVEKKNESINSMLLEIKETEAKVSEQNEELAVILINPLLDVIISKGEELSAELGNRLNKLESDIIDNINKEIDKI